MIAMIVMFLAVLAMLSVIPYAFTSVQTNALQVQAVAVAQQYLDDERNAKLQNVAMPTATTAPIDPGQSFVANGATTNTNYGNFIVAPNGCAVQFPASPLNAVVGYLCSATVSWTQAGASRSVTVQSYVTK